MMNYRSWIDLYNMQVLHIFPKMSYKKMTYIVGTIITLAACFPAIQSASDVLTYLGLLVAGMGAVCITEHFIFPKIGYTRYWNLYKKSDLNWAALISWGLSLAFFILMLLTQPIHQNFWFIPTFLIAMISYIILAGFMGAKEDYAQEEQEEMEYEKALQDYVNQQRPDVEDTETPAIVKCLKYIGYAALAGMLVTGILFWAGSVTVSLMKTIEFGCTIIYFASILLSTVLTLKKDAQHLASQVFAGMPGETLSPEACDVEGFKKFMEGCQRALLAERAVVKE